MPQILLQGFPDNASRIGPVVSILKKDGLVTYFVGPDNYFSHPDNDKSSFRFAIATLIANQHAKACEVEAGLDIPHRTLMNWNRQLAERRSQQRRNRNVGDWMRKPRKEWARLVHALTSGLWRPWG